MQGGGAPHIDEASTSTCSVRNFLPVLPLQVSPEFKAKVMDMLTQHGFDQLRSSKMAQEEFLRLLAAFNADGFIFPERSDCPGGRHPIHTNHTDCICSVF